MTPDTAAETDAPPAAVSSPADGRKPLFRDTLGWYLGVSAFWFATSFKWFILFLLQPLQVASVVPGGEKNGAWGMVVAIGAAEAMIGPALLGYLSDRCRSRFGRRRPFIAIGAALTAIALLFLAGAQSLWVMVVGYLFLQVSDDIGTGPYAAIIPDVVPTERRGKASGIMSMLQLVAQICAVAVAIPLHDITKIYIAVAVVNVLCAVAVLLTVRERRYVPAAGEPVAPPPDPARQMDLLSRLRRGADRWIAPFRSPDFRWVWFTRFLCAFGFYLILLYVSNYLTDRMPDLRLFGMGLGGKTRKDAVKNAALVAALVISLAGAVGAGVAGRLTDVWGRKRLIVYAGWLMFAALVPFSLVPNYTAMVSLAVVFGFGYGAYLSASWALAADVLPSKEDSAKDMGIWQASIATPQILTGAVGFLVDIGNRSVGGGAGYTLAFLISAGAFLAGCLLVARVRGSS
jgi:MFS family permease